MSCKSFFSIKESKKETGGSSNYPAKAVNNPEGGFIMMPYFGDTVKKMIGPGELEEGGGGHGWGFDGPSVVVDNPQGGIIAIPFFSSFLKSFLGSSEASVDRGKWDDCVHDVDDKGGDYNAYAVCTAKLGVPAKQSEKAKKTPKLKDPREPKPAKPKKGKPVHKKLHDNPHPILAEAIAKVMGKSLEKREAASSSMTPLVTVGGQKKAKESKFRIMTSKFRESAASGADSMPTKFRVVLLEEGMGNSHDAFYYTKEALESAVDIFTGLKIMADHPSMEEEEIRPERSTRDILGHYENLAVEEAEGGQHQLCGDVDILPSQDCEWARARMVRALENAEKFPGRDFIGLSINASGPSKATPIDEVIEMAPAGAQGKLAEAKAEGIDTVKVVSQINHAVSCDLVTEAGAGGKVLNSIEGDQENGENKKTA